jgi:hypothetical protein
MGNTGEYTHAQSTRTRGHHRDSSDSAAMNEPHLLRRQLLSHSPTEVCTCTLEPLRRIQMHYIGCNSCGAFRNPFLI